MKLALIHLFATTLFALNCIGQGLEYQDPKITFDIHEFSDLSGEKMWRQILKENKGKVIYGNISGTWCRGCIDDYPDIKPLHDSYKNKEVVFITLWAHSKENTWTESALNWNFDGTHKFMTREQEEYIMLQLNSHKYPTYFMIDREGKIYKEDAPRPGMEYTRKHLDKLLSGNE